MNKLVVSFLFASMLIGRADAADDRGVSQPWGERGLFVFGSTGGFIEFDFWRKFTKFGAVIDPLTNCSDTKFFCAQSRLFNLVLPRQCMDVGKSKVGERWVVGNVSLTILRIVKLPKVENIHYASPDTKFLLGNAAYPYVLYEYFPGNGAFNLYFDLSRKKNFVNAALDDGNDFIKTGEPGNIESIGAYSNYFTLITSDLFGACEQEMVDTKI